jgi:hypothetical protein
MQHPAAAPAAAEKSCSRRAEKSRAEQSSSLRLGLLAACSASCQAHQRSTRSGIPARCYVCWLATHMRSIIAMQALWHSSYTAAPEVPSHHILQAWWGLFEQLQHRPAQRVQPQLNIVPVQDRAGQQKQRTRSVTLIDTCCYTTSTASAAAA